MDIFQILQEAKKPSSPKKKPVEEDLPDDLKDVDDNDGEPEDATEGVDNGTKALNDEEESEDTTETPDEDTPDDLDVDDEDAPPEDATEGVDDGTDILDDEDSDEGETENASGTPDTPDDLDVDDDEDAPPEDATEGVDDGTDALDDDSTDEGEESTDDTQDETSEDTEESNENDEDKDSNKSLLKDTIDLYYHIRQNIEKIDQLSYNETLVNKVNIQVKQNLTKLLAYLYDFITIRFKQNKYIDNLYMYSYFIESYKINIDMLKEISNFVKND